MGWSIAGDVVLQPYFEVGDNNLYFLIEYLSAKSKRLIS